METDDKVELGKVLGPTGLSTCKDFSGGEILQILVICNNVDRSTKAFKIMSPDTEGFKDCQQFFVVSVVVELQGSKSPRVISHGVDFTGVSFNGEDGAKGVVRGISLDNDRSIRDPMSEDRCGGKGELQEFKSTLSLVREIPWSSLPGKPCEWDHDVRVPGDKSLVKVSEAQERLNVLHFARFWPILYCLNFGLVHFQSFFGKDEAEVFHCIGGEVTLVRTCI